MDANSQSHITPDILKWLDTFVDKIVAGVLRDLELARAAGKVATAPSDEEAIIRTNCEKHLRTIVESTSSQNIIETIGVLSRLAVISFDHEPGHCDTFTLLVTALSTNHPAPAAYLVYMSQKYLDNKDFICALYDELLIGTHAGLIPVSDGMQFGFDYQKIALMPDAGLREWMARAGRKIVGLNPRPDYEEAVPFVDPSVRQAVEAFAQRNIDLSQLPSYDKLIADKPELAAQHVSSVASSDIFRSNIIVTLSSFLGRDHTDAATALDVVAKLSSVLDTAPDARARCAQLNLTLRTLFTHFWFTPAMLLRLWTPGNGWSRLMLLAILFSLTEPGRINAWMAQLRAPQVAMAMIISVCEDVMKMVQLIAGTAHMAQMAEVIMTAVSTEELPVIENLHDWLKAMQPMLAKFIMMPPAKSTHENKTGKTLIRIDSVLNPRLVERDPCGAGSDSSTFLAAVKFASDSPVTELGMVTREMLQGYVPFDIPVDAALALTRA